MFARLPLLAVLLAFVFTHDASATLATEAEPGSDGVNQLTVEQDSDLPVSWRLFEPNGAVLFDRMELRLPASLTFVPVSAPAGWSRQEVSEGSGDDARNVITYFYKGFDANNGSEYYSFTSPASFSFFVNTLDPNLAGTTQLMDMDLFASVVSPDFGIIPAIHRESFGVTLSTIPEPKVSLVLLPACLLFLRRIRRRFS